MHPLPKPITLNFSVVSVSSIFSTCKRIVFRSCLIAIWNCIDEWTSVVDRTVEGYEFLPAKVCTEAQQENCFAVLSLWRTWMVESRLVDWLQRKEISSQTEWGFFFTEREHLRFDIKKIGRESWKFFSNYHYLSERLQAAQSCYMVCFMKANKADF